MYAYNQQRGWPVSLTDRFGSSVLASFGLTYDNGSNTVGNLTGVTEADGSAVSYGYDALYRLTGEARTGTAPVSHSFVYDLAGNLTGRDGASPYSYDAANKITSSGFSYDGDGDLLTDGTSYAWDDRGDLLSRSSGGVSEAFGYDGRGLRVVAQAGGGTKTFFVFDGDTLLGEIDQSGTVKAAYTWGAAGLVSERLVSSGRSLWYAFGPQGETRLLTDSTGNVADSYVYSAYGQPVASSGTDANPFRYGGQVGYYTDGALTGGAVLCTQRWYDPSTQRWLSRDPIGYDGGDNLYAYCGQDPVNADDPDGLYSTANFPPPPPGGLAGLWNRIKSTARLWGEGLLYSSENFPDTFNNAAASIPCGCHEWDSRPNARVGGAKESGNGPMQMAGQERPQVNTKLPKRVTNELPEGEGRTPAENAQARNFFERNRDKAQDWWKRRNGRDYPSDVTHDEHPRAIKNGGDPLYIEPGYGGSSKIHIDQGDFKVWGKLGGRPRKP